MMRRKSYIWDHFERSKGYRPIFDKDNQWWTFTMNTHVIKVKSWIDLPSPPKPSGVQISVVIINWNRPLDVVKSCIESVLNQDFPPENFEVILVDDASDIYPKSVCLEIVKEYPNHNFRAYLLDRTRTWCCAHGYNVGIKRAKGWIVMLLQSEAILDEEATLPQEESSDLKEAILAEEVILSQEEPRDLNDKSSRQTFLEGMWRHHNARDTLALLPRMLVFKPSIKKYRGWGFFPHGVGLSVRTKYAKGVRGYVENSIGDSGIDFYSKLRKKFYIKFTEDADMQTIHRTHLIPKKYHGHRSKVRPKPPGASYPDWPNEWGELTDKEEKNVIRS